MPTVSSADDPVMTEPLSLFVQYLDTWNEEGSDTTLGTQRVFPESDPCWVVLLFLHRNIYGVV